MAKFRDSNLFGADAGPSVSTPTDIGGAARSGRPIGEILRHANDLTAEQVEAVLTYQREKGVRFGEAAIALGLVGERDVLFALSLQFHYPYTKHGASSFSNELVMVTKPFSRQAEAFRGIRSQLSMRVFNGEGTRPAIAVVSPAAGDGKTYFAANIAVALSQLGGRTLLIDADLRGPRQHTIFQVDNTSGLSGILAGRTERGVIQQVRDIPSLYVLPVGTIPPNPLELLERPAFGLLLRDLNNKFDHVVVDTSAASYGADAQVVAARCGGAMVVARKHESRMGELRGLVESLSYAPIKMCGVVMNEY